MVSGMTMRGGPSNVHEVLFGGENSKTADLDALEKAKGLREAGANDDEVWSQTGWFSDEEGQWRYEIPDDNAKLIGDEKSSRLGDYIDHPELYAAYPHLADTALELKSIEDPYVLGRMHKGGWFSSPRMEISTDIPPDEQLSTGLHESQHAIDFDQGYNKDFASPYWVRPTEVMARSVQDRHEFSADERKASPPKHHFEAQKQMMQKFPAIVGGASTRQSPTQEKLGGIEMMVSGKAMKGGAAPQGMASGAQMAQFYPGDDQMQPDRDEHDVQEIERDLTAVSEMAAESGFDVAGALQTGDYESIMKAAMQSPNAATDGGIAAIENLASRLGLGSPHGADYDQPQQGDDYVFGGGAPAQPPMRSRGGIGHQ